MSTRGVIARIGEGEGEFKGVYTHSDSMPISRGPLLLQMIREHYRGNLKAMLADLIDKHPAGWSSLIPEYKSCFCHPKRSKRAEFRNRKPEAANWFTQANVVSGETDIEWIYAFDEDHNRMYVRDVRHDSEHIVELSEPEPNWIHIECGEDFSRCGHMAWFHKLTPKTCNLSTQTWLGKTPLDFHDAIAFVINGKRWAATGCGGNSNYLNSHVRNGQHFPSNSWVATVKAKNGKRIDAAVAHVQGREYVPLPGVIWIYPPTKHNPQETLVSA